MYCTSTNNYLGRVISDSMEEDKDGESSW